MSLPIQFRTSLVKCARLFSQEINTLIEPLGLNYSLWQVLYLIHHYQVCSALDIAHDLGVSKPSISKRIQVLLDKQLIEQIESQDKRQKLLQLTTLGKHHFQICVEKIDTREHELLSPLDPTEQVIAHRVLNQLITQLWTPREDNQRD